MLKRKIIEFKEYLSKREIDPQNVKTLVICIYVLLLSIVVYHVSFAKKIIPGVKVGSVRVGGKTFDEAKKLLEDYEGTVNKELRLNCEGKEFLITADEIDLIYNWEASISRAFEVGRTGNILIDTKDKIVGFLKSLYIGAFYDYDEDALGIEFSLIRGEINVEEKNAGVSLDKEGGEELIISSAENGKKVVDDSLYTIVVDSFDRVNFSPKSVPIKIIKPSIYETDIEILLPEIRSIVFNTIIVKNGDKQWVLETEQLIDFLEFRKEGKDVEIKLNGPRFESFSNSVSYEVNKLPRGKVTSVDGNKVLSFELITDGTELDAKKFTEDFKDAYFNSEDTVQLTMNVVSGPTDKDKYGIYALLGEGSSHFVGSASSRVHNLTLAAERTNGVLVAPGATYSLNNSVGDISTETGYSTAYIIKGDRTVLGAGGGVCQTSTTLFRAVLNSGLPIVTRYPHAYRVSYYEQDMPVGFDAAVFQPSWDFQFKNDTDAYVLVQSEYNASEYSLTFKLYGTPDGRTVEIPEPIVTNQSPPPPALYQDDPTLAKGVVKQIDFAAWGASVKLTRSVYKNGELLFEDNFNSNYQPWRAIYLVGIKE